MVTSLSKLIAIERFEPPTPEQEAAQREQDRVAREWEWRHNRDRVQSESTAFAVPMRCVKPCSRRRTRIPTQ